MVAPQASSPDELQRLRDQLTQLQSERQRLVEMLSLAERDRQLLGYELHDGIVQDLTAAAMHLESAAQQATFAVPSAYESHLRGIQLIRGSIVEARRLISGLAAVELEDVGLIAALERVTGRFRTDFGLDATFSPQTSEPNLPPSSRLLLLRIAQEALNNVWKHAPGSRVQVRLASGNGKLELTIADDGPGFDTPAKPGHFGLDGMRARAHILGAEWSIDSQPGEGTRVLVRLALPPPDNSAP